MAWFMGARFPIVSDVMTFTKSFFAQPDTTSAGRDEL